MKYFYRILIVVLVPALTTLTIAAAFPSWNAWAIAGVAIGTFVLMIVALPGMSIKKPLLGSQLRATVSLGVIGIVCGLGLVWVLSNLGVSALNEQLKAAYIIVSMTFSLAGVLFAWALHE